MKPYVICHMTTTVDGRIQPNRWPRDTKIHKLYEKCHVALQGDAWIIGRKSMEGFASNWSKNSVKGAASGGVQAKRDFIADANAKSFAIVIDPSGKCKWPSGSITGDHVIEVLTEKVSLTYLARLQAAGVSYIFAGKSKINLKTALSKLLKNFGIKRLLLEGGGSINGSFLKEQLIDELSLLLMPLADGQIGTPTLFDAEMGSVIKSAVKMKLKSLQKLPGDVLWLRYKIK